MALLAFSTTSRYRNSLRSRAAWCRPVAVNLPLQALALPLKFGRPLFDSFFEFGLDLLQFLFKMLALGDIEYLTDRPDLAIQAFDHGRR